MLITMQLITALLLILRRRIRKPTGKGPGLLLASARNAQSCEGVRKEPEGLAGLLNQA